MGKFVCVGLDPDLERIPESMIRRNVYHTLVDFNRAVIMATHDLVGAYKPNTAFYEAHGPNGLRALEWTIHFIHEIAPQVPVIVDAKRADIGNTNRGYAKFIFDRLQGDAVTVHPYLGHNAMEPFLERDDKGIFVLCRTSNPGSHEFQELLVRPARRRDGMSDELSLYEYVAYKVASNEGWNKHGNCSIVVGATYPKQMRKVREIVGDTMLILAPGVGKQGGDVAATVNAAKNSRGQGLIVNSSSDIIFASGLESFSAEKVRISDDFCFL